jgi:hypothetical protein
MAPHPSSSSSFVLDCFFSRCPLLLLLLLSSSEEMGVLVVEDKLIDTWMTHGVEKKMWRRSATSCARGAIDFLFVEPHTRDVLAESGVVENVLRKGIQPEGELLVLEDPNFCGLDVTLGKETIWSVAVREGMGGGREEEAYRQGYSPSPRAWHGQQEQKGQRLVARRRKTRWWRRRQWEDLEV